MSSLIQRVRLQLVVVVTSSTNVSHVPVVAALQDASTAAFIAIAALAIRDWFATRERSRMYLALAVACLAAVSLLGQLGKLLGPGFAAGSSFVTIVIFLGSGLALLLFRDSVIPLSRRTRRLVILAVAATAVLLVGVTAVGATAPKPLQLLALAAFVVVWSGCVGEPSVRLWLSSRQRTAVQRARMRALSLGYLAIIGILVAAVATTAVATQPAVEIAFALASIAIVPLLYAGFAPPAWLRRTWRAGEESKLQQATHDILLFSADQATLSGRALEWAVRLTGSDAGFISAGETTILATQGITSEEAQQLRTVVGRAMSQGVVPLGGTPPRTAIVTAVPGTSAVIVLLGGPFTPVFGNDERAWIRQYASLVSTGLDRVRLVEEVDSINRQLQGKVGEVTQRTQELEAANRELEAFSYSVSHDLRAPLRAINGFTSILFEDYADALPAEARRYLQRVKDSGEHMGHLVDDLLNFSRLGRQAVRRQRVSIRSLVDRAMTELSPALEGRHVEVVIGELPDGDCDPALVEQVFVNLLSNAFKYSRRREHARVEVGVAEGTDDPGPVFFVRDNGAGFDMEYAGKLFGVFQRLHRAEEFEGTGVGLAIVQRVVERHGGRVWAEAKVDEGATFYFTLKGAQTWRTATAA
jgi:signal transduction histidine kinase